jgi:chromosome segregation ATPase
MEIQRYGLSIDYLRSGAAIPVSRFSKDGAYVLYDDHLACIARMEERIEAEAKAHHETLDMVCKDAEKEVERYEQKITALEAYKANNYDPAESIRLNGEVMEMKEQLAARITECEKLLKEKIEYQEGCEAQEAENAALEAAVREKDESLRQSWDHKDEYGRKIAALTAERDEWNRAAIGIGVRNDRLREALSAVNRNQHCPAIINRLVCEALKQTEGGGE